MPTKQTFEPTRKELLPLNEIIEAGPPDGPEIRLSGDFPTEVVVVTRTMMSLLIGTGRIEETEEQTLVPYVELKIGGGPQSIMDEEIEDPPTLLSQKLPIENAVYLAANLAYDIRAACRSMRGLAGTPRFEKSRLEVARFYAAMMTREAFRCAKTLHEIIEKYEQPSDAPRPKPQPKSERAPKRA